MNKKFKYDAFISYRHKDLDKSVAVKLQKLLEGYKPPKSVAPQEFKGWHIFRDETELPTSSNLSEDIKSALENSRFLIVICSKTTKLSRWCMEEINYFKQLHNGNNANIITLVADGEPAEVFPEELCSEMVAVTDDFGKLTYQSRRIEPLAASIVAPTKAQALKKLKTEFLRIAAPLLGCGYDSLYNRDQRRKVRRIFTVGAMVASLMFLFGVYSSAMLLEISHQKEELQLANAELHEKTLELNQSNTELQKANTSLAQKTKEAQTNLVEANLQRETAEKNLAEAQKQKKLAEENLAEANKQKKIAENNLKEVNKQKSIAEKNLKEANKQKSIAEENANEANKQKSIADENANEANKQKAIAEENANEANKQKSIAEENATEANKQKVIAEENANEANRQKELAEKNMLIAQENEAKAKEANKNLKIKNNEILANQAQLYLDNDDVYSAVETATEVLSQTDEDMPYNIAAERVLAEAVNVYSTKDKMLCRTVEISGYVNFLEFSADGSRILAGDTNGIIYVIDYDNSKIIKTFTPLDTFGETTESVTDICVDGNTGYVLKNDQFISINLSDGSLNWHYNKDHNDYTYSTKLATNPNSDIVVISSSTKFLAIRKSDGKLYPFEAKESNFDYGSYTGFVYMDSNSRLYDVNIMSKSMAVVDFINGTEKIIPLDIGAGYQVLSMGETDDGVMLNMYDGWPNSTGKLMYFNKNDMSLKWSTDYTDENASSMYTNQVFELTHKIPDDVGEYFETTGIIVISGHSVLAFDKRDGNLYFKAAREYGEEIIYCESNGKYSLMIGTPKQFGVCYLYPGEGVENAVISKEDLLLYDGTYTFDKERKYIAYSEGDRFALASDNSAEISLYYKTSFNNYTLLENFSDLKISSFDKFADNGDGIIAAYYYDYIEDEKHDYIVIYDVNSDKLLAYNEIGISADNIYFTGKERLFIADNYGEAVILDFNGNLCERLNLEQMIRTCAGIAEDVYVSVFDPYIKPGEGYVIYCVSDGMFRLNLTDQGVTMEKVLYNKSLKDFCITNKFASFIKTDYHNGIDKIAYFKDGDSEFSYIKDNGTDASYIQNSISSVINSDNGHKIAYINKEGYIGVYTYGDENVSKIMLPRSETAPLKIIFTPDSKYIIAMCSNGVFIKYSVETLSEVSRFDSETEVSKYSVIEFVDDNTILFNEYEGARSIILIDCTSMQLKSEISNYSYFMKADKKIIFNDYIDLKKKYGYFNYRSAEELVEIAKEFLAS